MPIGVLAVDAIYTPVDRVKDVYKRQVVTMDGSLSAHYENTILITDGDPEILTLTK